jgi:PAS domain S-box-containing protein
MGGTFLLSSQLDLFEGFHAWTRAHEGLDIDEIVMPGITGVLGFAIYSWRRNRDAQAETHRLEMTERVLAARNEDFRSLFEYNPGGVFSLDLDGRFVSVNPASESLSGYTAEELQGMDFPSIVREEDLAATAEVFGEVLKRRPQQFEAAIVHKDGHAVELSITGVPIVIDDEVTGVFGIAEDISDRMRTLRELERARLGAEQASELKSLFVANVSHEIRTPLTSVLAATEMLQDTELDAEQTGLVDAADRSGRRLLRLVNDILDFSELGEEHTHLDVVDLDPGALARGVADRLRAAAQHKGLDFDCVVDPDLVEPVAGDPARIAQVLGGLVENAVKFTETGWVKLSVELAAVHTSTMDVRFTVQDSGIGLSEDQQGRAFESFSQADQSISRKYEGAGIGLAICRRLVTLMGGSIWVDSTLGEGSRFSFQLPLSRRAAAPDHATESTLDPPPDPGPDSGPDSGPDGPFVDPARPTARELHRAATRAAATRDNRSRVDSPTGPA